MFLNKLRSTIEKINQIFVEIRSIQLTLAKLQEGIGRLELKQTSSTNAYKTTENEFRVFSQWGEDGTIQFLVRHLEIQNKIFVEFGVENYTESNTRFLLINNNWSGLIIDGDKRNVDYIKNDPIYWRYNLKAVHSFVTKDNINSTLSENGIKGEIGILSIDIDGNDYWVWKAINLISPAIVIIEYNFRFGKDKAFTIPYDENFIRSKAHHSTIYYGASLKALCLLAEQKGYAFVGCNSAGNNAFFVRKDLKPAFIDELTPEEGYVCGQFRESRDVNGNLLFLSQEEEQKVLANLPLVEVK